MVKRRTTHRRNRRNRRRTRNRRIMKGGAFSQQEIQQLQNNGFNEFQIEELEHLNIPFNDVMNRVDAIMNQGETGYHGNSDDMAEQVMTEITNQHNQMDIDNSFDSEGTMNLDELNGENMSGYTTESDNSFISQGPMNLDELNTSNMSGYTTEADESFGGKKSNKKRKQKTKKRGRKTRKMHKYKGGGTCFGNGVGSNHYDPNYSIYNTNMLKLFPYKS